MTEAQRDELLISVATGLNELKTEVNSLRSDFNETSKSLQGQINDVKVELANTRECLQGQINELKEDVSKLAEDTERNFEETWKALDHKKDVKRKVLQYLKKP